jgi:hypothetical protein
MRGVKHRVFGLLLKDGGRKPPTQLVELLDNVPFPRRRTRPTRDGTGWLVRFWNKTQCHWNKTTDVVGDEAFDRTDVSLMDVQAIFEKCKKRKRW